jgi:plasmid maintenance system antidote protein VapI
MMLSDLLSKKELSVYQCSKAFDIPYTTLLELIRGKTRIEKCSAETVYKLAKALGVSVEWLLERYSMPERQEFETFKGNACHLLKLQGDKKFIEQTLKEDTIRKYWELRWYPEAFYMLAMIDYLCRVNGKPIPRGYEDMRGMKLDEPIYPQDVLLRKALEPGTDLGAMMWKASIPEFAEFNIMEANIRDVY